MKTMQAGRELDALIAEKVMGFERDKINSKYFHKKELDTVLNEPWVRTCVLSLGDADFRDKTTLEQAFTGVNVIPHYSNSIDAAWEVVGKVLSHEDRGYSFDLATRGDGSWECQFYYPYDSVTEYGGTAPEAICKAALKSVGVEI